jgi:hypothetical protein
VIRTAGVLVLVLHVPGGAVTGELDSHPPGVGEFLRLSFTITMPLPTLRPWPEHRTTTLDPAHPWTPV